MNEITIPMEQFLELVKKAMKLDVLADIYEETPSYGRDSLVYSLIGKKEAAEE